MKRPILHPAEILKTIVFPIAISLLATSSPAQTIPADSLYLGQTPPGDSAIVFAPGKVTITGRNVPCISFSPDGKSAVFYVGFWPEAGTPYSMLTEYKNNRWTAPAPASFTTGRTTGEPSFSSDGNRIYLFATDVQNQVGTVDVAYSERIGSGWSTPKSMGNPPNLAQDQYHPSIVSDTSLYFSTSSGDIARCQYRNGKYQPRVILPFPINQANTTQTWGDPYVAPDESYLIFKSTRTGGFGLNDIYISYKKADESWTNPKNLGNKINTRYEETAGDITPDGKYMTFASGKTLFWVSTSFITTLKNTNFVPYQKTKLKNLTGKVGDSFNYTIPDSAFIDDDGNNTLTCYVTSRLPLGIDYDPDTRTFSGSPNETGTFTVNIKAIDEADAYVSTSFTLKIDNASGINNLSSDESIRVYPNPTKGDITLAFGTIAFQTANVKITNITGAVLFSKTISKSASECINLSANPKGLYFLSLTIDGVTINRKICLK